MRRDFCGGRGGGGVGGDGEQWFLNQCVCIFFSKSPYRIPDRDPYVFFFEFFGDPKPKTLVALFQDVSRSQGSLLKGAPAGNRRREQPSNEGLAKTLRGGFRF